ncbi:hypothetical protein BGZ51_008505 [Haplosporangium sp. Z 767]|nr:hypothetical protein BGZ51_008505 [Haplosporangium sp. Z 767]
MTEVDLPYQTFHCPVERRTASIEAKVDLNSGEYIVLWSSIQLVFQNVRCVQHGIRAIECLIDPTTWKPFNPPRIKYYPGVTLEVVSNQLEPSNTAVISHAEPRTSILSNLHISSAACSGATRLKEDVSSMTLGHRRQPMKYQPTRLWGKTLESLSTGMTPVGQAPMEAYSRFLEAQIGNVMASHNQQQNEAIKAHMNSVLAKFLEEHEKQHTELKMNQAEILEMQRRMQRMQEEALDRLLVIQSNVKAVLVQTYELFEYPIPRLFIVLPVEPDLLDRLNPVTQKFRLYFLCECGEHTKVFNDENTTIPHHIHLAKHEGYDLQRPKEFFQKYGRYMLTLLEMIKYGFTITSLAVPALVALSAPGAIDRFKVSLNSISQSDVNKSIEYLQDLTNNDPSGQNSAKDVESDSFSGQDALEGADLRHLEAFIKGKDKYRTLGNLYRIVTQEGHVKWVCIDHYRSTYKEKEQQAFSNAVQVNNGSYEPQLGQVVVHLESKTRAAEFFNALANARRVDDLDITFGGDCSRSDLEVLQVALKKSRVSILRLDLRQFRSSFSSKMRSTAARYEVLLRIMELPNMKMIHIVFPKDFAKLSSFPPRRLPYQCKLSFEMVPGRIEKKEFEVLAETLKTNSILTTLNLKDNSIGDDGALALSEVLKINSTLTTLDLRGNSIGNNGARALSEALMTNSTLITLDLRNNSIGDNGALALSKALKNNPTLATLDLRNNWIGDNGAQALSEALMTNSILATLDLWNNSIGDNGALALSEALMINSTLTTLNLEKNSIGDKGAIALSEALMTNSTLTTLDLENNWIGDNGARALSEALMTNSALTILDLRGNSIGDDGTQALSEVLKNNSILTTVNLRNNSIGDNGAQALSEALMTNSTLTTLDLRNNSIGDNGALALSEALMTNSALTTLNLEKNSIGDNGALALSEALMTNSTLTTLDLENNWIGDNGALALSEVLKTNSILTTVNLRRNSIGDNGTQALSEAFKTNSTLTTLDLNFNSGALSWPWHFLTLTLSQALKTNSTLTTLDLRDNSVGDNGAQEC